MEEHELKMAVSDAGELKKRLEIEVPSPRVMGELDRAFQILGQRVRLRGFRPGKVPRAALERMYGQQVRKEVVESLVRHAYDHALAQHQLVAVAPPEIVVEPLDETRVLRFSATVDVCPEVSVSHYEGIEVTRPEPRVDDDAVDQVLSRIAEAAATVRPVEGRPHVEAGDIVTAVVTARIDGESVGDPAGKDTMLEAGPGPFPGALEECLVGRAVGTSASIDVEYPADYQNAQLAGKRVTFGVEIKAIGSKIVPTVDDEFARAHGQSESLSELRDKILADLMRDAERKADGAVREAVVNALIERHPFDAPERMVERRCDALIGSLNLRLPDGPDGQKTLATLRQELRPRAVRDGKAAILLDRLAAEHGLDVDDREVRERVEHLVHASGATPGQVREYYADDERRKALRTQIMREKALELVVDRSKILTVEKR